MVSRFCSCNGLSRNLYFLSVILVTDLTNLKQIVLGKKKKQSWLVGEEEVIGKIFLERKKKKCLERKKKKPSYIPLRYRRENRKKKNVTKNVGFHSGFRKEEKKKKKIYIYIYIYIYLFIYLFILVSGKKIQNLFLVFRKKKKRSHIWPCGFPFWIQGGEPPLTRKHQTNNLVCWKVLCKINKNTKEGFELKTLSSRAKAHSNKPHALL